jgi:uncharacterized protein with ParB-like and HNH nuclease domain/predicted transport protein
MKAQEHQFLPFLNGKKQFIIPIYQRTYSWRREQCAQLWQDIVRVGTDQSMPGHFLGSIVFIQQGVILFGNVPQFLLIDGQQRLTTLILLLAALAEAAQDDVDPEFRKEIYDSYLVNTFGKDEQRYKLLLTQSDREVLKQIIDHPQKVSANKTFSYLVDNYNFFCDQLKQHDVELNTVLQGINKLFIVEISLNKEYDNPQLIFESLNSTGMDLSQADLIRNYVLMGMDNDEQSRLYKEYWYPIEQKFRYEGTGDAFDRFMRDYLTLKQGIIPNIDKVYTTFKQYHRSRYKVPIREIIEDIACYADYFANIAFLHEEDPALKQAMRDINVLKVDVAYPFFLELYDDYQQKVLSKSDFLAIIRLVESYVFRRAICGIPTNALNKVFVTLAKEIDKAHYLESFQAALLAKGGNSRFPHNDEFRGALITKDVYNYPRRNYLLRKLENYQRKELVAIENCTIEHIMPQNARLSDAWKQELGPDWKMVHEKYLHTIGNLTLTGYNSALSDRPFQEKRTMKGGFDHSPLQLNESVAYVERWDQQAIEKRAGLIADLAMDVWVFPDLSVEQVNKYSGNKASKKASLAEIIGPIEHPQAGFIPAGFKLIQTTEKRFYLFRSVENEWVQYGNGKNPWFAISWDYAREWVRDIFRKNEMPLGVGGEKILVTVTPHKNDGEILTDYFVLEDAAKTSYTLADYPMLQGNMLNLYNELRKRVLNLSVGVREEIKKLYIAYKLTTNFVDVGPQKNALLLYLNMPFEEIDDPKKMCEDVTHVGHRQNGDIRVRLASMQQLEDVMYLVQQAFERQNRDEAVA